MVMGSPVFNPTRHTGFAGVVIGLIVTKDLSIWFMVIVRVVNPETGTAHPLASMSDSMV